MDMMALRRKVMAAAQQSSELYPIGTDICDYYGFKDTATTSTSINAADGDLFTVASNSYWTSENYAEIDPAYTYAKKYYRLYRIAFYDQNKDYISYTDSLSTTTEGDVLQNIPDNARYVRIAMYKPAANQYDRVGLVRTANDMPA